MSSHSIKMILGALCWEKALAVLIRADKIKHSFFMVLLGFYSISIVKICYCKVSPRYIITKLIKSL